jgi:hypothetical protein
MADEIKVERFKLFGDWLAVEVGVHTCAGGTAESNGMHEPSCGYEPVAYIPDVLRDVRANTLAEAANRLVHHLPAVEQLHAMADRIREGQDER